MMLSGKLPELAFDCSPADACYYRLIEDSLFIMQQEVAVSPDPVS